MEIATQISLSWEKDIFNITVFPGIKYCGALHLWLSYSITFLQILCGSAALNPAEWY